MRQFVTITVAAIVALSTLLGAQARPKRAALPTPLAPLEFLLGEWDGGGGGVPGQADGGTKFATDLQGRVIVRTNFAVVAATDKAPASRHDDLMVIFADEKGVVRADYYDNEGHVIRYSVTAPSAGRVIFTSDAGSDGPRYRLAYETVSKGAVKGTFSMAAQGNAGDFSPYLTWQMRRR